MSLSNLMGPLEEYADPATANMRNAPQDFDRVSRAAPRSHLASALVEAFRSNETPPFPEMLSTLFRNSNGRQRAGILSHLLGSAGPTAVSGILGQHLGGRSQLTPEQADQIPFETVHQLAERAEKNDPSIVERASEFYAQHPTLIKALGAGSLVLMMSHMSRRV